MMIAANMMDMAMSNNPPCGMGRGPTGAAMGNTTSALKLFEPTTLPTHASDSLFSAAIIEVTNSGILVPVLEDTENQQQDQTFRTGENGAWHGNST